MPALTCRRDPDARECWLIYYGDVHVGTIALLRTGMAGSAKHTEADFQAWRDA
jgi:hypothetical protein